MAELTINEFTQKTTSDIIAAGRALTAGRPTYFLKGPRCFDDRQLQLLRDQVDQHGAPAEVMSEAGQKAVADVRRTRVCWLAMDEHRWVYDLVWTIATTANQLLRFDIAPVPELIQLARYDAEDTGFFEWHADTVPSDLTRKISISVPLNGPAEYEGGVLEVNQGTAVIRTDQDPGAPIIFPSWLIHRVTPVTRGRRYSLVAWIRGPNWR
jgi:predicted 2-oxoglutarate/Fe(II)-dependent dioxygenase YbiX